LNNINNCFKIWVAKIKGGEQLMAKDEEGVLRVGTLLMEQYPNESWVFGIPEELFDTLVQAFSDNGLINNLSEVIEDGSICNKIQKAIFDELDKPQQNESDNGDVELGLPETFEIDGVTSESKEILDELEQPIVSEEKEEKSAKKKRKKKQKKQKVYCPLSGKEVEASLCRLKRVACLLITQRLDPDDEQAHVAILKLLQWDMPQCDEIDDECEAWHKCLNYPECDNEIGKGVDAPPSYALLCEQCRISYEAKKVSKEALCLSSREYPEFWQKRSALG